MQVGADPRHAAPLGAGEYNRRAGCRSNRRRIAAREFVPHMMSKQIDPFQTRTMLRETLAAAGLTPRKLYGQHFMIDRNLLEKLVNSAELTRDDVVLEVGAGTGSLTGHLAQRAGRVIAVEIDQRLAPIAADKLSGYDNVQLIVGDALARKSQIAPDVLTALRDAQAATGGPIKLVANLPYDIATSLVIDLLIGEPQMARLCFTVQDEVARRFLGKPDSDDYGPVSILTDVLATGRRIAKAPPQAFWPEPKVDSALVRLDVPGAADSKFPMAQPERIGFAGLVRHFFQYRRKTLGSIARKSPWADRLPDALTELKIDLKARPETLAPQQWRDLFRCVSSGAGG